MPAMFGAIEGGVVAVEPACGLASLRPPLPNRRQNIRHDFGLRLRSEISFAVNAEADGVGFHVAVTDEQGVDSPYSDSGLALAATAQIISNF